ncbi:MAG: VOC family protein [Chitinophagia bacterium]|nr:VOC family protein [Chitinophagia bacterium]
MRLDHISYAASHDQVVDVVQRLGSRIGTAFTDGGIHPRFGTRNFTLPLLNGRYIEVVCPLEHPAADSSAFGKIVSKRANEGGGWLSWVVSTEKIEPIENRLNRKSVEGHRTKPDGTELKWKQVGVLGTLDDYQLPFFIEWETSSHPSEDGKALASIEKIELAGDKETIKNWLGMNPTEAFEDIEIEWIDASKNEGITGIVAVQLQTPHGKVRLD